MAPQLRLLVMETKAWPRRMNPQVAETDSARTPTGEHTSPWALVESRRVTFRLEERDGRRVFGFSKCEWDVILKCKTNAGQFQKAFFFHETQLCNIADRMCHSESPATALLPKVLVYTAGAASRPRRSFVTTRYGNRAQSPPLPSSISAYLTQPVPQHSGHGRGAA